MIERRDRDTCPTVCMRVRHQHIFSVQTGNGHGYADTSDVRRTYFINGWFRRRFLLKLLSVLYWAVLPVISAAGSTNLIMRSCGYI